MTNKRWKPRPERWTHAVSNTRREWHEARRALERLWNAFSPLDEIQYEYSEWGGDSQRIISRATDEKVSKVRTIPLASVDNLMEQIFEALDEVADIIGEPTRQNCRSATGGTEPLRPESAGHPPGDRVSPSGCRRRGSRCFKL
jgi:hypothetical protein